MRVEGGEGLWALDPSPNGVTAAESRPRSHGPRVEVEREATPREREDRGGVDDAALLTGEELLEAVRAEASASGVLPGIEPLPVPPRT